MKLENKTSLKTNPNGYENSPLWHVYVLFL